ncbi:MAG: helix-turn-helix domain-containing protein [Candidatus Lokiarchaeota archaeon]|nr:helix-turn-helix domain-containing protein [Candidatus Lokiarchaeota archaeon]
MIEKILQRIDLLLKKANYETLALGNFAAKKSKFCFDLLFKKDDWVFSVKIFPNIDNLNPSVIRDIKSLSTILKSKPLLIGIRNRYQKLEDNTIYIREDLPFITVNTFENILDNKYPHILARRGGGVVFLDGNLMKTLREDHTITRKELSDKLGVTKRTLCAYENESMRPSERIAKKILEILEDKDLFKKINIFGWPIKDDINNIEILEGKELSEFETHVQDIIKDIGLSSYWYKKGSIPFKLSLYSTSDKIESEGFYPLFSGISEEQGKINEMSFRCLKMFTELFHKTSLFIIDNGIKIPEAFQKDKIPIVKIKKLEKVDDEEEFIELIHES